MARTISTAAYNQKPSKACDYEKIANGKIDFATAGLLPFIYRDLTQNVSPENALDIAEYILAMKTETNLSDAYRTAIILTLSLLSRFSKNKSFAHMTRDEILFYLDSIRKPDMLDPLHKWIGTYNLKRIIMLRFFKWFYYSNEEPKKRKIPAVIENIPVLKMREQSVYKPTDLWTVEDDHCYHAISRDTSCRPHEILRLRIRDIIFKTTIDNYQYAEVLVNGKTGSRSTPLFNSIPYIKDWLDEHIQRGNSKAFLIPSRNRENFGKRLAGISINTVYRFYKSKYFPRLLEDSNVPIEDKNKIRELLKKPCNPYIPSALNAPNTKADLCQM